MKGGGAGCSSGGRSVRTLTKNKMYEQMWCVVAAEVEGPHKVKTGLQNTVRNQRARARPLQ